ncbi:MAG: hypothetical protein Q4D76_05815 [Oscillospiraceae bacterium]|nr:hypothetical protein [Oscillospiraceae bacterium]
MHFSKDVLTEIENTIGALKPECGGIIAMNQDGIISDFYFDIDAGSGKASYVPSRLTIQNYVRKNWSLPNRQFCGVVHSHPLCNTCEPSYIDINMALKIMSINKMEKFYLLLVLGSEMKLFCVTKEENEEQSSCIEEKIEI